MLLEQHFQRQQSTGCYFHLTQSVLRKINEISMREDYEKDDSLIVAICCLPALAIVPSPDVTEVFLMLTDNLLGHKRCQSF